MDEPNIAYSKTTNTFTMTYSTTTFFKNFVSGEHLNEEFYTTACKTDDTEDGVITDGIFDTSVGVTTTPSAELSQDSGSGVMTLAFKIDPAVVTTNGAIYTDLGATGELKFCVRAAAGYGGDSDSSLSLQEQITGGYKEVNFIESLITIVYDLEADFDVVDINVKPKDKVTTTFAEDEYGIEAWLCNITALQADYNEYKYTPTGGSEVTRSYPPVIDDVTEFFRQGSLVSVCIRPVDTSYAEGIVMKEIVTFDWEREGGPIPIEQPAVEASSPASNLLTYYPSCTNLDYCRISSILFADFYITEGTAEGSGSAKTQFKTSRRLGAEDNQGRALQEAETSGSRFDVNIALAASDDGPGALKTAGGASLGFTALASFMALAGSMLFF